MKWIVIGILACIVPYTWLTLAYRKAGPAHEPYQDNKDRAQVLRLLDNGFSRFELPLATLVDPMVTPDPIATTEPLPGGLPPLLRDVMIDPPVVPTRFAVVTAPTSALSGAPYDFTFTGIQPHHHAQPTQAVLYLRQQEGVIVVAYAQTPGDLQTRKLQFTARLTLPAHTLAPGTYQMTVVGAVESRRWTLEVH